MIKYWLLVKELAWAAWLVVAATVMFRLAQHVWNRWDVSVVFVASVALGLAFVAPLLIFGWDWVANLFKVMGDSRRAELLLKDSLARWQKIVGDNGPGALVKKGNLADFYFGEGRDVQAESLYKEVKEGWEKTWLGLASPLCEHLENYGHLLRRLGREEEHKTVLRSIRGWRVVRGLRYLVSFSLVLLAISYLFAIWQLREAISSFPDKPGRLAHEYVDELARIERAVLGAKGAGSVYFDYGYAHQESSPWRERDEDEVYWGLKRSIEQRPGLDLEYILLAEIDLHRANLDQSEALFKEALKAIEARHHQPHDLSEGRKGTALAGLGKISAIRQQYDQSAEYFERACQSTKRAFGEESDDYIEALLGFAEAKSRLGKTAEAEALANQAAALAEKVYLGNRRLQVQRKDDVDRLIAALVKKGEILRIQGKEKQARALDMHIDDIQRSRRPHVSLDEKTQALIVEEVRGTTACMLAIKYKTTHALQARKKLTEKLSASAAASLQALPWYQAREQSNFIHAPHMAQIEFDPISVTSPDEIGYLHVGVRGRFELKSANQPTGVERFSFVFKIKPRREGAMRIDALQERRP